VETQEQKEEVNINSQKEGIIFTRRVVRDKPVYEYTITKFGNPSDLVNEIDYTKSQLDNSIILKKIEDKVAYLKGKEAEQ
jgi:hypothetical protein